MDFDDDIPILDAISGVLTDLMIPPLPINYNNIPNYTLKNNSCTYLVESEENPKLYFLKFENLKWTNYSAAYFDRREGIEVVFFSIFSEILSLPLLDSFGNIYLFPGRINFSCDTRKKENNRFEIIFVSEFNFMNPRYYRTTPMPKGYKLNFTKSGSLTKSAK